MDQRLPLAGAVLAAAAFVAVAAGCGDQSSQSTTSSTASVSQYTGSLDTKPNSGTNTSSGSSGSPSGSTSAANSSTTASAGTSTTTRGATGAATTNPKGSPTRVYVFDSAGRTIVNASLVPTYLDAKGVLAPPAGLAGWYAESGWALPGKKGASILVGHVTYAGGPDTFYNLLKVTPGNKIIVAYSSGDQVSFNATRSAPVSKAAVPKDTSIWAANSPTPVLRLITCDPKTPINGGHFEGNWVVWAVPS